MKALEISSIMADLQQQISLLNQKLQSILDNAPSAEPAPTEEVVKLVSKLSNKTFGNSVGFWQYLLQNSEEDQVLLWRNGAVTTYGSTSTKNPVAVFSSRHKARLALRSAGWDVPFAYGGLNCGKFVVATRK